MGQKWKGCVKTTMISAGYSLIQIERNVYFNITSFKEKKNETYRITNVEARSKQWGLSRTKTTQGALQKTN